VQRLPKADVVLTDFGSADLKEQAELISQTVVHVTGSGGGSFVGTHLQCGATHIGVHSESCFGMEWEFFSALGSIHVQRIGCNGNVVKGNALRCGKFQDLGISYDLLLRHIEEAFHRHDNTAGQHPWQRCAAQR
jgi:hypothetical protein